MNAGALLCAVSQYSIEFLKHLKANFGDVVFSNWSIRCVTYLNLRQLRYFYGAHGLQFILSEIFFFCDNYETIRDKNVTINPRSEMKSPAFLLRNIEHHIHVSHIHFLYSCIADLSLWRKSLLLWSEKCSFMVFFRSVAILARSNRGGIPLFLPQKLKTLLSFLPQNAVYWFFTEIYWSR